MAMEQRAGPAQPERRRHQQQLRRWQKARTWARLIREAEALWRVNVRDLRRLGALELAQLLQEVPPSIRPRVNRWLEGYGALTRLA
ncbi:hypothetical protein FQK07_07070 [Synechococcus sp. BSF8S]|uniref:hypothetical protein n=1 Tax=Synechococcales TaxID=1890424 RepID=UPI0016294874|nr:MULTISPECIES: hypothetical protein [unclassified Synechococcus]MBC1261038.1 hypothetical protein [Synechococcus sp. BSF8S]MBC1263941.1 hypothetical protein [Synechococcus sp. BSA11S]